MGSMTNKAGLIQPGQVKRAFKVLDLFSGIGGFSLAAEWAGGETMAFCEVAGYPSQILKARWPDVPNLGDVTKLCRRIYDCYADSEDDETAYCPRCEEDFADCECIGTDQFTDTFGFPDVITGGVPCQPASLIGERRGTEDERWLWPEVIRIMGELQPQFGLFENPAAILNLEDGRAFNGILSGLARIGYDVLWEHLPAYIIGAGHRRERVWLLATNTNGTGLERYAGHGQGSGQPGSKRPITTPDLRIRKPTSPHWYLESGVQPVVDGLPGRLVRDQHTAIGNSIVPQMALPWMQTIAQFYGVQKS